MWITKYKENNISDKKILKNENFNNNQNYILGNFEKKKLLSKFFMEKSMRRILIFFSKINTIFRNEDLYVSFFWITSHFSLFVILVFVFTDNIFYILLSFIAYIFFIFIKINTIPLYDVSDLNVKSFFIRNKEEWISMSYMILVLIVFSMPIILLWYFFLFFPILLFLIIIPFLKPEISRLKLVNISLFSFIFIYQFILLLLSFIFVFIIRWIFWYKIIKMIPNTKILSKFNKINKESASNEYLMILEK